MVRWVAILSFVIAACGGAGTTPATNASAGSAASASAAPTKLVIGFSEIYEGAMPMWYARDNGIFKKNGLDVDLRFIASSTGVAALVAGEINLFMGGGSEVLSANVGGADLVLVSNLVPIYPYVFMVPDSIKSKEDLKGKKVGVSAPGSTSDIATRIGLAKIGIDPDKDVTIVAVGSSQNRTAAMLAGSIQGGLDQPPSSVKLEANGFHVLFDEVSLKLPVVNNGLAVKRDWMTANRASVQKYVDSLIQSIAAIRKDKAGAVATIKKEMQVDDQKALDVTYTACMALFPDYPYVKADQLADSVTVLGKLNDKIKTYDLSKMLDTSFVKSAEDRKLATQ